VGGNFTAIGGLVRDGLGSVNATTGAVDANYFAIQLTGHMRSDAFPTPATALSAPRAWPSPPDGKRVIVDGNFINAADSVTSYARDQIVSIDLTTPTATIDPNWNTDAYTTPASTTHTTATCVTSAGRRTASSSWSPRRAATSAAASRTATRPAASKRPPAAFDVQPTWKAVHGTDSLYSVAVTTSAVYVGGHQRWLDNPYGQDYPGPGAVPRPGSPRSTR